MARGFAQEQHSTAAPEECCERNKLYTLDLTTVGVDIKPVCIVITTIKRLSYVIYHCWQDRKVSGDPLDVQKSVPAPSSPTLGSPQWDASCPDGDTPVPQGSWG